MQSQQRRETYRGHKLCVDAWEQRPGAWGYTVLIDGKSAGRSANRATLPTAEAALNRGMLMARASADALGAK